MIGARLGNWIIDKELGHGGMGSVYLAHEVQADGSPSAPPRPGAVKMLSATLALEGGFLSRFEREILALQKLKHLNIVQFFEAGAHAGAYYYVMEYAEGPRFDELLDELDRLPWDDVLTLGVQICAALKHAHDHGIIHRDIKPTNLILGKDGVVKLLDFGVAKVFANTPLTATHAVVGTADFMSPEQAAGKPVTRRSDLYSLGVVMYKLITGRTPFQAKNALEMMHKHRYARFDAPNLIVPEIPHALNEIICQLLEKEPEKRPPDALVLSRELESIRRRAVQKSQITTDMGAQDATVAEQNAEGSQSPAGIGPATLMSQLVRKELEDLNREGPISRLLNRAWLLVLLLGLIVALIIYGLWPKDPDTLLQEAETLVARAEWRDALAKLDRLDHKHPEHPFTERTAELRKQITDGQTLRQARRTVTGTANINPAASDAERFYREALLDYQVGKTDLARQKWQWLADAFSGIEAQKEWVLLAQDWLKKSAADTATRASVEEAVRVAKTEPVEQARKRLKALADLYAGRDDTHAKEALARIARAVTDIEAAVGEGK